MLSEFHGFFLDIIQVSRDLLRNGVEICEHLKENVCDPQNFPITPRPGTHLCGPVLGLAAAGRRLALEQPGVKSAIAQPCSVTDRPFR